MAKLSPMMVQYNEIKEKYKDCILFFRLGDFYEMFFEDALLVSRELEIALTGRDCGMEERAPMCGVPHHSSEAYIKRLLDKGYKVAICEQLEDPSVAKGVVKRDVIRIVTPGTITESGFLDETRNNYICSVYAQKGAIGVSFADVSTGDVYITELNGDTTEQDLINELAKYSPSEILFNPYFVGLKEVTKFLKERLNCLSELMEDEEYDYNVCTNKIKDYFQNEKASVMLEDDIVLGAKSLGVLLSYLDYTQRQGAKRIINLNKYSAKRFLALDLTARRNLELCETMRNKEKRGTLLWVLDKTKTAMGKRLIRKYIEQPLINVAEIINRQTAVRELIEKDEKREALCERLSGVYDLERLLTKVVFGTINPKELQALAYTLSKLPLIKQIINDCDAKLIVSLDNDIDELENVKNLIENAVDDEPPATLKDGGVIRDGFNEELDELRGLYKNAKTYMAEIEQREKEITGIKNLRIGYNRVFGYYIEVSKGQISQVPDTYIRKQTLANCERYITQELKELESKVLTAGERIHSIELSIFNELVSFTAKSITQIQRTANSVAALDVLCSFAVVAKEHNYVCPEITMNGEIDIKDGRHPVVEKMLTGAPFVPNDTFLDRKENRLAVITGPNMAGKSTYMRQCAIITIMAQMGSFVPAKSAKIGVVDRLFTRVGASDDLSSGQSTFMVEMSEVSHILKNATSDSLIILDEIGRGTSTFDGMSIARAVVEHIVKTTKAKTLFATHYHELTCLEDELDGIKNYNIAAKKHGDDLVFLRKIVKGGADDSYGIEVAKLAGVPSSVVKRAKEVLKTLESGSQVITKVIEKEESPQMSFGGGNSLLEKKLEMVDPNTLSPIEALNLVFELKKMM